MPSLADRVGKAQKKKVEGYLSTDDKSWYDFLNDEASVYWGTQWLERTAGIPPLVTIGAIIIYFIVQTIRGEFNEIFAIIIGTLYPMFKSVQALQTEHDAEDDKVWLSYWVIYSWLVVSDTYVGFIMQYIPLYPTWKFFFIIWLQLPGQYMGARFVYGYVLAPLYKMAGKDIGDWLNAAAEEVHDYNRGVAKNFDSMKADAMDKASQEYLKRAAARHQEQVDTADSD